MRAKYVVMTPEKSNSGNEAHASPNEYPYDDPFTWESEEKTAAQISENKAEINKIMLY